MIITYLITLYITYFIWTISNGVTKMTTKWMVKKFSDDIAVEFGLDKCINESFKIVKLIFTSSVLLDVNVIKQLEHEDIYIYLGFYESQVIKTVSMKAEIRK